LLCCTSAEQHALTQPTSSSVIPTLAFSCCTFGYSIRFSSNAGDEQRCARERSTSTRRTFLSELQPQLSPAQSPPVHSMPCDFIPWSSYFVPEQHGDISASEGRLHAWFDGFTGGDKPPHTPCLPNESRRKPKGTIHTAFSTRGRIETDTVAS
jgi:hypothetical protein